MTGEKVNDGEFPDLEALLGESCLLNVVHTTGETVYANIQNASPLPKGMEAPELFNDTRLIDINSVPFADLNALPEFIQKKMKPREEYGFRLRHQDNMAAAERGTAAPAGGKLQRPGNIPAENLEDGEGRSIPF